MKSVTEKEHNWVLRQNQRLKSELQTKTERIRELMDLLKKVTEERKSEALEHQKFMREHGDKLKEEIQELRYQLLKKEKELNA